MDPETGITELEAAQELVRLQSEEIAKLMEQRRVMLDALRELIAVRGAPSFPRAADRKAHRTRDRKAWDSARAALKFGGEG